jgi:hypothetical protein
MKIVLDTKKDHERYYLDLFRSTFPRFPAGSVEDGESPDFIVHSPDGKIGIELTRIYRQARSNRAPLQSQESERDAVVADARQIYETMELDPVQVHFAFEGDSNLTKRNRKKYAHTLAMVVAKNLPPKNSWLDVDNDFNSPESFPFEVHNISIARFDSLTRNAWSVPVGGFVLEDCRTDFQRVISQKDLLVRDYRDCREQWLLIVADWSGPSSFFEPSTQTLTHVYRTAFDRIFFLSAVSRRFVELPIEVAVS